MEGVLKAFTSFREQANPVILLIAAVIIVLQLLVPWAVDLMFSAILWLGLAWALGKKK